MKREEIFITTKLWKSNWGHDKVLWLRGSQGIPTSVPVAGIGNTAWDFEAGIDNTWLQAKAAVQESLRKLNTGWIDLLLLHCPGGAETRPETWAALEECVEEVRQFHEAALKSLSSMESWGSLLGAPCVALPQTSRGAVAPTCLTSNMLWAYSACWAA